jgi:large repetitive protein
MPMNKVVRPTEAGNRSGKSKKSAKRRPGIILLEPRVMYDGAAAASVAHHADHHHDHPDGSATAGAPVHAASPTTELATPPNGANPNGHSFGSGQGDWSNYVTSLDRSGLHHGDNVVFVDSSIADYQAIVSAINPGTKVFVFDGTKDGLQQIAVDLQGVRGLASIDIISHGAADQVQVGTDTLSTATISNYSDDLKAIGNALSKNGQLDLYGCNVAAGGDGFIDALQQATGRNVAASTDATGATALGANWTLEASTNGVTPDALPANLTSLQAFADVLATPTAPQTVTLTTDADHDGGVSPGDTVTGTVTITNTGGSNLTGLSLSDVLNGLTVLPNGVEVTPLAINESYSLTGNTPITIDAGHGVLANDIEFNGSTLTAINATNVTGGTVVLNADGSFTFTPTTGFSGTASFQYTAHDALGLNSDQVATVTLNVAAPVWYVDSANSGAADGSFAHPFTTIAQAVTAAAGDASAGVNNTIFVENAGSTYSAASGITLKSGEQLLGDGSSLTQVNGNNVGLSSTNSTFSVAGGTAVTLNSGNTISGINITNTGSGAGIVDDGSTVTTLVLSNVDVTTGAGAGISLTHGGGSVTGSGNMVSSTGGGIALDITNTNIGSGGLSFTSISDSGGAPNGIILSGTGTSGGLTVTGDGSSSSDNSGGTITGTTGDGVLLTNTQSVVLTHMSISNTKGDGVFGSGVNGFVCDWNTFSSNGSAGDVDAGADADASKESAIRFGFETDPSATGLTGGAIGSATETRIDNTLISGAFERGVSIFNNSGTLTQLDVHNTTIQNSHNGSGMLIELRDGAVAALDVQGSTFSGNFAVGLQADGTDSSTLNVTITGSTFTNNTDGIEVLGEDSSHVATVISGNTFTGQVETGITVSNFTTSTSSSSFSATILNNNITIPTTGVNNGIQADGSGVKGSGAVSDFEISGNIIMDNGQADGISVGTPDGAQSTPDMTAIVTNNTVTVNGKAGEGIDVSDEAAGGTATVRFTDNTVIWGPNAVPSYFLEALYLGNFGGPTLHLEQGTSGAALGNTSTLTTVAAIVAADNPNAAGVPSGSYKGRVAYIGSGSTFDIVTNNTALPPSASATLTTPTISGTAQEGVTLSASGAVATGGAAPTFQWQESFGGTNFVAINGATGSTYTLTEADIGAQLRVVATTLASDGFRTVAISGDTATVTDHLTLTTPVVSGTDTVGQILTASTPTADNADATISYQWQRNGVNISGADGQTYRLTAADVGDTIDVVATATDPHGGSIAETSPSTGTVTAFTPLNLSNLSLGTLPGNDKVTVTFLATVNAQTNQLIVNPTVSGTLSGAGFANVITNATVPLDTLTLGGFIFDDANADGLFNAGDSDISGVSVSVFAQGGTTALETVTTDASGVYDFTGLAAGNYFVQVNASNFAAGGALATFSNASAAVDATPNDGLGNRNYGEPLSNGVVDTNAITLSYRAPASGGNSQTTLDVGFVKGPNVSAGATATFTGGGAAVVLDSGLTVSDGSGTTLSTATVSIGAGFTAGDTLNFTNNGTNEGNIAITSNANGKLVLTSAAATATVAQWRTALDSITYSFSPVTGDPTAGGADTTRTINWTVNDGILATTATSTLDTVHVAPTVTAGGSATFTGGGGAVMLDSGLTVSDPDSGGTLASATVKIVGAIAGDTLNFVNNGTTEGNISISSNAGGQLVLTSVGATATVGQWQTALDSITYSFTPVNGDPTGGGANTTRTIDWTVSDGSTSNGSNTPVATSTLNTVHVPPTVTAGATVAFESGNPTPVALDGGLTVTDVDSGGTLASATVQIVGAVAGDTLSFTNNGINEGNIAVASNAGGQLVLTSAGNTATVLEWQTALDSVTFSTNSTTAGSRTIDWTVSDGSSSHGSNTPAATSTVNVTLGPQVTAGGSVTFNGGDGPLPLDTGVALSDPSSTSLSSATVSIASSGFVSGDTLNFTNTASITGSYDAATGVLKLTGIDTVADYQTALDSITYSFSPVNGDPTGGGTHTSRTIDWSVSDAAAASNTATSALTTVHVAPTVTAGATTIFETGGIGVDLDSGVKVTDPDSGGNLTGATVSIGAGFIPADDTLTINGTTNGTIGSIHYSIAGATVTLVGSDTVANYQTVLDSITFATTATAAGSRTIDWTVTDGVASSAQVTSTLNVEVGPQVTAGATVIFDGGGTTVILDAGLTLGDPFSATLTSATATISSAIAGDTLTINGTTVGDINDGTNGTIHYSFANGTMTLTGADTVTDYQAAMQSIAYSSSGDLTRGGTDFSRTVSYAVTDANGITSPTATSTVETFATPVLTGGGDTVDYTQGGAAVTLESNFGVTDLNGLASLSSATVTIGSGFAAGDTLNFNAPAGSGITGVYDAATGVLTLSGSSSLGNYVTTLDSVTFATTAPIPFGATLSRAISWSVNDDAGGQSNPSAAVTSTVDLLHTDSAPVLSNVANTTLATEQTPAVLDGLATVSDAELDQLNSGHGDYNGASLTIARSGGATAEDSFGFQPGVIDPTNGNTLTLSGGAIQSNGVTIATLNSSGGTLTLTFTDAGETVTTALANTVLEHITYTNQSDAPPASVALAWSFSDGNAGALQGAGGAMTATGSTTVDITAVNDAPVAAITDPTYSAVDGASLNLKGTGLSVNDVDGGSSMETATLSVGEGVLTVTAGGSGAAVAGSGTSTVTINGTAAEINALLNTDGASTVSYIDSNIIPAASTTLTLSVDDNGHTGTGGALTSAATSTIDIHALPIVTAGATTSFEIGATAPTTLDPGLTVTDASSATLINAAVSITGGFDSHDTLSFTNNGTNEGDITGSYLNGTLTLTSTSGTATLAQWRAALDSVAFSTTATAAGTRTIGWIVNDGTVSSAQAHSTVNVVTGPVVTAGASVTFDGGSGPLTLDPGLTLINQAGTTLASATVSIGSAITGDTLEINRLTSGTIDDGSNGTISYSFSGRTLTLTGTDTVADYQAALDEVSYVFSPANGDPTAGGADSSHTINWSVNDGAKASNIATSTLNLVHVAPTVTTSSNSTVVAGSTVAVDAAVTVSDPDSDGKLTSATVSIGAGFDSAHDTLGFIDQNGITGSYDSATGVLTLNGPASLAGYQSALDSITFTGTTGGSRTIDWTVSDNVSTSAQATNTIDVVTAGPILTVDTTATFDAGGAAVTLSPTVTVTDTEPLVTDLASADVVIGNGSLAGDTLTFNDPTNPNNANNTDTETFSDGGKITASFSGGILALSGSASLADYQTALSQVQYSFTGGGDPTNGGADATRTINWSVTDTATTPQSSTVTSTVDIVRAAPVVGVGPAVTFDAGGSPVVINFGISVTDASSTSLAGATVSVSNFQSGDVLGIVASDLGVGNTINGTSISESYNSATGVLTLSGPDTLNDYQSALSEVTFSSTAAAPSTFARTINFEVNDGTLSGSTNYTVNVHDLPVVTAGATATFNGGGAAVPLDPTLTLTDPSSATLASATVSIGDAIAGDTLTIGGSTSGIFDNIAYSSNGSTITFTDLDTVAHYQAALDAITYNFSPVNGDPTSGARTIDWSVSDGTVSGTGTATSTLDTVHVAPTVTAAGTATFAGGGAAVTLDSGIIVSDPDSSDMLTGATVTIGNPLGGDVLAIAAADLQGTHITVISDSGGVLTLGGSDTVENYQAVLRDVTYSFNPADGDPTGGVNDTTRTINWAVTDGATSNFNSNIATTTLDTVHVAPTVTVGPTPTATFAGGGAAVALDGGITVSDPDSGDTLTSATISVVGFVNGDTLNFNNVAADGNIQIGTNAGGTMTLTSAGGTATLAQWDNALQSVTYTFGTGDGDPTAGGGHTSRVIDWSVSDGVATSATATTTLDTVHVAPTLTTSGTVTFDQTGPAVTLDHTLSLSDPDSGGLLTGATVQISSGFLAGDTLAATTTGAITASYDGSTGELTLSGSGSVSDYQTVLQSVTFTSSSANPTNNGSDLSRTITWTVNDGVSTNPGPETSTVAVHALPTVTAGTVATFHGGDPAVVLDSGVTVSDPSGATIASATVTIGGVIPGDTLSFTDTADISGSYNSLTGVETLTGTNASAAEFTSALDSITYSFTANGDPTGGGAHTTRTISWAVNDGTLSSSTATSTLDVVHEAPVVTAGATAAFGIGRSAVPLDPGLQVTDVDSGGVLTSATVKIGSGFVSGDSLNFAPGAGFGDIAIASNVNGQLVLTSTGNATLAQWQDALESITFSTTATTAGSRTIDWSVTDGATTNGTSATATSAVEVTVGPEVVAGGTATFTGGGPAVPLDGTPAVIALDPFSTTLASATVSISGAISGDTLNFAADSSTEGNITIDIADSTSTKLVLTSAGDSATLTQWNTALDSITYTFAPVDGDPTGGGSHTSRTINWSINDGTANSAVATSTLDTVHVAPTITAGNTTTFELGSTAPVALVGPAGSVAVNDVDSLGNLTGATVSISGFAIGDSLNFTNTSKITGIYNAATGVLTLTGADTLLDYQAALDSITFSTTSAGTASHTIDWTITDGVKNASATSTLNVVSGPQVTAAGTVTFNGGDGPLALDPTLAIVDASNMNIASATVTIGGFISGDTLNFVDTADITGSYDAIHGVETLTGHNASVAEFTSALDSITYSFTTNGDPTGGGAHLTRTISWAVNDGVANSNTATTGLDTVHVPPTVIPSGTAAAFGIGGSGVPLDAHLTVTDPDSGNTLASATVTIGAGFIAGEDTLSFVNNGTEGNIGVVSNIGGTLVLGSPGDTATLAQWDAALEAVTFTTTSAATGSRTIDWTVSDNVSTSTQASSTLDVVLGPQVLAGATATYMAGGTPQVLDGALSVADPVSTTLASATVTIAGAVSGDTLNFIADASTEGNIAIDTADSTSSHLVLTSAGGSATLMQWQAALDSITYSFTANTDPTVGGAQPSRTIDWVVNDGTHTSATATSTLDLVHAAPVVTAGVNATFLGGGGPVTLDGALTVADIDSGGNLDAASVQISAGFLAGDTLSANTAGTGITASYDAVHGILALSGTASVTEYQTVLDSVTYSFSPTNGDPTGGGGDTHRVVTWVASDGVSNSAAAVSGLNVVHVAPSVVAGAAPTFTGGGGPVVLDGVLKVSDGDSANQLVGATVSISSGFVAGDTLTIDGFTSGTINDGASGTINYAFSGSTLTLSGTDTVADYQAVLDRVTYSFNPVNGDPTGAAANSTSRTISWVANDGSTSNGTNAPVTSTLDVVHVPPTLTAGSSATFTGGGAAVALDAGLSLSDVDSGGNLTGATVSISSGFIAGDTLDFVNQHGITGSYDAATGVLTLSGTASLGNYQLALDSISYRFIGTDPLNPNDGDPTGGAAADTSRTVSWVVTDGAVTNGSNTTATSSLTTVHVAPSLTAGNTVIFTQNEAAQPLDNVLLVKDVDSNGNLTGATVSIGTGFFPGDVLNFANQNGITGSYDPADGVLTLTGSASVDHYNAALDSITFISTNPNPSNDGANLTRTISWSVTDGAASNGIATATSTVDVHAVPTVVASGDVGFQAGPGNSTVLDPDIGAFDGTSLTGATVTIATGFQNGEVLSANTAGTNITASYNSSNGVLTLSGTDTPQDYQQVLRSVTMTGVGLAQSGPATIDWQISDQTHTSKVATSTVEVTAGLAPPPPGNPTFVQTPGNFDHGQFGDFSGMLTNAQFGGPTGLSFGSANAVYVIHSDVNPTVADNGTIGFDLALNQLQAALGGDVVSVTATMADGKPLPAWLHFDNATGQFAGLVPDDLTGSLDHDGDGGFDHGQGGSQLMTVEVVARDSKGNLAVTDFVIHFAPPTQHKADKHGWNVLPSNPHHDIAPLHAMNHPMDHVLWHGVPALDADRVHAISHGGDAAPAGRAGFSDQIRTHGWHAVTAQRMALLDSLRQGVAGWR